MWFRILHLSSGGKARKAKCEGGKEDMVLVREAAFKTAPFIPRGVSASDLLDENSNASCTPSGHLESGSDNAWFNAMTHLFFCIYFLYMLYD